MPKYKIGDQVWYATYNKYDSVTVPCSVCYGKKKVTVILGNDDTVVVDCDYCGHGFEPPTGTEKIYRVATKAEMFTITGMEVNICGSKETVEYRMSLGYGTYKAAKEHELFDTEAEALIKAEELKVQDERDESEKQERIKKNVHRSFTWNVGYHMREAKRAKHDLEYHSQKALICKARPKN